MGLGQHAHALAHRPIEQGDHAAPRFGVREGSELWRVPRADAKPIKVEARVIASMGFFT
jgi:hypothetical protein